MVASPATAAPGARPPLGPALLAMAGLQAVMSLAIFAPGVVAPKTGLTTSDLALFTTAVFAAGMVASSLSGRLVLRFGPGAVAVTCCLMVTAAMAVASAPGVIALVLAGLFMGCAFGPETPASTSMLMPLTRPERRPFVFSLRQTGNQIGAMAGSLALPPLCAIADPRLGYLAVAAVALAWGLLIWRVAPKVAPDTSNLPPGPRPSLRRLARENPALVRLAVAAMAFGAMQLTLNSFLVTLLVRDWGHAHIAAGTILAVAQFGGLIGRLFWGALTSWGPPVRQILAALGIGMGACAILLAWKGAAMPSLPLILLAGVFGLTASGWNGIFVAEVARLAPEGRLAETTGAVITVSYAGLLAGPTLVAAITAWSSLATAFAVLGILCWGGAILILGARR